MNDERRYRIRDKRRNAFMNIMDDHTIFWHKRYGIPMKYDEAENIVKKNSHYEMVEV